MPDETRYRVRIDRHGYWRNGHVVPVGSEILLPAWALPGLTDSVPAFGSVLGPEDLPDPFAGPEPEVVFESLAEAPPGATSDVMRPRQPDEWTDFE